MEGAHCFRYIKMPQNLGKNLMFRHFPLKNRPAQIGTPFKTKEIWRMKSTVKTSKIAFKLSHLISFELKIV